MIVSETAYPKNHCYVDSFLKVERLVNSSSEVHVRWAEAVTEMQKPELYRQHTLD